MVIFTGLRANDETVLNSSTKPRSTLSAIGPRQIAAG